MVVQSRGNRIILLPALPKAWESGSMKGLRIKGNAYADISWENGRLVECKIYADSPLNTRVRYQDKMIEIEIAEGKTMVLTERTFS